MSIITNPKIWGPPLWEILHYMTFNYCPAEADKVKRIFLLHLPALMPCKPCRYHYLNYINELTIRLETKESLSRWLVRIHNMTNKQTCKPLMTYEDAKRKYTSPYAKRRAKNNFIKWTNIMTNNIRFAPLYVKSSYSFFLSFYLNYV